MKEDSGLLTQVLHLYKFGVGGIDLGATTLSLLPVHFQDLSECAVLGSFFGDRCSLHVCMTFRSAPAVFSNLALVFRCGFKSKCMVFLICISCPRMHTNWFTVTMKAYWFATW